MYVLQIDVEAARRMAFCASWPGYWAGLGYVEKPEDAVPFPTRRAAGMAALSIPLGLNNCMRIVPLERKRGPMRPAMRSA